MDALATNPLPGLPHVESPLFEKWRASAGLTSEEDRIACDLNEKGFAVFDFPVDDFDSMADELVADLKTKKQFAGVANIGPGRPAEPGERIGNYTENANVREIACNQTVLDLLTKLYGRRAFPFQTLNFAMGTQQHYHSDSVHFSSVPERFMVGVWVALEDIGPEQGPLVYYPGSHKWPILYFDQLGIGLGHKRSKPAQEFYHHAWAAYVEANGVEPEYFHAKKGQALIWAANLLHGGMTHTDHTKTRWSQVTHYYFDDCCYVVPLRSNPRMNRMFIREGVTDISTGKVIENQYYGHPASEELPREPTVGGAISYQIETYFRRRKVKRFARKVAS